MKQIVKRNGYKEVYDTRKLYASIYAACMSLRRAMTEAELIADHISREVEREIAGQQVIHSGDISKITAGLLKHYDSEAAYIYRNHKDVS